MVDQAKIRRIIKRSTATVLRKTGAVHRRCKQGGVIILMLHKVDEKPDALPLTITPEIFDRILTEIGTRYPIVDLDSVFDENKNFHVDQELKFVITFDDGYRNNYDYAYPILKRHNAPAIIYLSLGHLEGDYFFWYEQLAIGLERTNIQSIDLTDLGSEQFSLTNQQERENALITLNLWLKNFSDEERMQKLQTILARLEVEDADKDVSPMLSWDMVKEMQANNISFGSHTISHPILSQENRDSIANEVIDSKKLLEEKLGVPITGFAYPNGRTEDYNVTVLECVDQAGYLHATTTIEGTNYTGEDPHQLKRINLHMGMCTDDTGRFHADLFWAKITSSL